VAFQSFSTNAKALRNHARRKTSRHRGLLSTKPPRRLKACAGENVWEAAGTLPLHELEKIIGTVEHDEGIATASGWVTQKFGGFPKSGETLAVGACELRVEEMDGPRVARLKVTKGVVK